MPPPLGAAARSTLNRPFFPHTGNVNFAPGACDRLEPYLSARIVGQDLALRQVSDAICDHLAQPEPTRPLVLSLHGPPGVGKSMLHLLAAQALYNRDPEAGGLRCPGLDCAGYKVGSVPTGCARWKARPRRSPLCCLLLFPCGPQLLCSAPPEQVLYGMDYTADERQAQHAALRASLLEHLRQAPESREWGRGLLACVASGMQPAEANVVRTTNP